MKRLVIATRNLPVRLPLDGTVIAWLLVDRLQPPFWIKLLVLASVLVAWIQAGLRAATHQEVDVFTQLRTRLMVEEAEQLVREKARPPAEVKIWQ